MIRLALDFTDPESYLALSPTIALAQELGVELQILPYHTPLRRVPFVVPDMPSGEETVRDRHARVRATYNANNLRRYFERRSLPVREVDLTIDSTVALCGLLASGAQSVAYASRVFEGFWRGELKLDDVSAIGGVLAELGVEEWDPDCALGPTRDALTDLGVFSVPMYVVADQAFMGRQHLPMVRWLLDGSAPAELPY